MADLDHIPFVQAHFYRPGRTGRVRGWTIHSMESPEKGDTAESVARYFARADIRPSSAHYNFDSNSVVQSVKDTDTAYHAPGVSHCHIGAEHAGYARQTAADWRDPYSWSMLQLSAALLAKKAAEHGFPIVFLDVADLKAGRLDGVTTHWNVSKAFGKSSHWDPGEGYPIGAYLEMAKKGSHTVKPPEAATVMKLGDKGAGVAFLADMLNIMGKAGFRINADGKKSSRQLAVPTGKNARNGYVYDRYVREAVAEVQRFGAAMARMAGGPKVQVDGVAGKQTAAIIAFWIPVALKNSAKAA